jgi:hypothetical protein
MKLSDKEAYEYQKIVLGLEDLFDGLSMNAVIPAVMAYLAAAGAFSGAEKKEFISYVVAQIDNAFDEFDRRVE